MPQSALREITADYGVDTAEMGALLTRLARTEGEPPRTRIGGTPEPKLTDITCPDCRGTLWEIPRDNGTDYRCRVGHSYSPKSMLAEHFAAQEKAMWAAVVALEEGAVLTERLAGQFGGHDGERLRAEGREHAAQAEQIRRMLRERQSYSIE
jgi:two-component system chemotaxis response regulator CheB